MGNTRRNVLPGPIQRTFPDTFEYIQHLTKGLNTNPGLVPTDGIQRSSVVTFGTLAVPVDEWLIDPGVDCILKELEVGLTQRFTELPNTGASVIYFWRATPLASGTIGAVYAFTPTISKAIGSLANSEDSFSGFIDIGQLAKAPFKLELIVKGGAVAGSYTAEVKTSSYVRLVGSVIPGA